MLRVIGTLLILWGVGTAWATPTVEQPDRNVAAYNLTSQLALRGFDPVSAFAEHGVQALQGDPQVAATYGGVMYHFASEENRQIFLENPTKFEPTYGGWCAWGMANNSEIDVNPMVFTQNGDRMHYFLSRGAKARFDAQLALRESAADSYWKQLSGEEPRL
jgi:YHS domain-containing protein